MSVSCIPRMAASRRRDAGRPRWRAGRQGGRSSLQAACQLARSRFASRVAEQVFAAQLPKSPQSRQSRKSRKSRKSMQLDTVLTICDVDLLTVLPEVGDGIRVHWLRPVRRATSSCTRWRSAIGRCALNMGGSLQVPNRGGGCCAPDGHGLAGSSRFQEACARIGDPGRAGIRQCAALKSRAAMRCRKRVP